MRLPWGGRLFATYFEAPETQAAGEPIQHPNGVKTHSHKDPFHYRISEMESILIGLPWRIHWAGEWRHPRDQNIMIMERFAENATGKKVQKDETRNFSVSDSMKL